MIMINQPIAGVENRDQARHQPRSEAQDRREGDSTNMSQPERIASTAAGAVLTLWGLSRQSIPGLLIAGAGGVMLYRGISGHCPAYEALGVDTAHPSAAASPNDYFEHGIQVQQSFTIGKQPWELYAFWRDFTNLPRFMRHLESVEVLDEKRSRWTAKAPAITGGRMQWEAEIINDEPNALIAWRSLGGSDVDNTGSVRFVPAPGDRGTEVHVVLEYIPPVGGRIGSWIAKLFGEEPQMQIQEDLRRFKRLIETGEIPTTQGQPRGNCSGGGTTQQGW
jgi:uncharacterized membrane protein